jgi:hypothetical protein
MELVILNGMVPVVVVCVGTPSELINGWVAPRKLGF